MLRRGGFDLVVVLAAAEMDHADTGGQQVVVGVHGGFVQAGRAQGAAGDEQRGYPLLLSFDAEVFPGRLPRGFQHLPAHGQAGVVEPVGVGKIGRRRGKGQADGLGFFRQAAVGQAGIGVLLVQQGGQAQALGCLDDGGLGVTAGAHHQPGSIFADGAAGLEHAAEIMAQVQYQPGRGLMQPAAVHTAEGKTGVGRQLLLGGILGPHVQHLRPVGSQLIGNGQRRVDVTAGAAAADDSLQQLSAPPGIPTILYTNRQDNQGLSRDSPKWQI